MALAIGAPFSDGGRSDDDDDLGDKEDKSKYEYAQVYKWYVWLHPTWHKKTTMNDLALSIDGLTLAIRAPMTYANEKSTATGQVQVNE